VEWPWGRESVPGAFDDAFYEIAESKRSDAPGASYRNHRFGIFDQQCGQAEEANFAKLYPPQSSYQHNDISEADFPRAPSAPYHPPPGDKVQLLGVDAVRGRNDDRDECGVVGGQEDCENYAPNGVKETDEVRWVRSAGYWEYGCGVYGVNTRVDTSGVGFSPENRDDVHAFSAVGDARRATTVVQNSDGTWIWGAERWPGASNPVAQRPDPPDGLLDDDRATFCQLMWCPDIAGFEPWQNFLLVISIHELGHLVGNIVGDTSNCPAGEQDQSIMDYKCQRRGFGPGSRGVKWFSADEIKSIRQGQGEIP